MQRKGWFHTPGLQGERSLQEQMAGLEMALAEAPGKTVADFGCAEGLIALEFARAGASSIFAIDYNVAMIRRAKKLRGAFAQVRFECDDIAELIRREREGGEIWRYDIVLALAIVHKMMDPVDALDFMAAVCRDLLVLRLPAGSEGEFGAKHRIQARCDVRVELPPRGFRLERDIEGPRGERVHYWRRCSKP